MILVRESIEKQNFTRSGDPYGKLGIGRYEEGFDVGSLEIGDRIELQEDLYNMSSGYMSFSPDKPYTKSDLKRMVRAKFKVKHSAGTVYIKTLNPDYSGVYWENPDDKATPGDDWMIDFWVFNHPELFKKIRNE